MGQDLTVRLSLIRQRGPVGAKLGECLERAVEYRQLSARSAELYLGPAMDFAAACGDLPLARCSRERIAAFIEEYGQGKSWRIRLAAGCLRHLEVVLGMGAVAARPGGREMREPFSLATAEEVEQAVGELRRLAATYRTPALTLRYALVAMCRYGGAMAGELANLRRRDVGEGEWYCGHTPRTLGREATVALERWYGIHPGWGREEEWLFVQPGTGSPLDRRAVWSWVAGVVAEKDLLPSEVGRGQKHPEQATRLSPTLLRHCLGLELAAAYPTMEQLQVVLAERMGLSGCGSARYYRRLLGVGAPRPRRRNLVPQH
jgi:hypothetical protein